MMKKVRWLILLGLLMVGMVLPGVRAAEPWDTIKQVVTLGPLMNMLGYSTSPINPTEGLVRFLILILMFTVFFAGAELLKLGRNVSIVIAAVFALISAIFIPGPVLVAAGASYGSIISLALLAVPILLLLGVFFMLKDHPKARLVVLLVEVWILYTMKDHLIRLGGTNPSFVAAQTPLDWIIYATWGAVVLTAFSVIMSLGGGSQYHPNAAGSLFDRFTQKTGLGAFTEKGQELRHARVEKTRTLNLLAAEQEELKVLNGALHDAVNYNKIAVNEFLGGHEVKSKPHYVEFTTVFDKFEKEINEIKNNGRALKKAERNEYKEMEKLVKEMAKNGVSDGDRNPLEAESQNILNKYILVSKSVDAVLNAFGTLKKHHDDAAEVIKTYYEGAGALATTAHDLSTNPKLMTTLNKIKTEMEIIIPELNAAISEEDAAVKATAVLTQQIKDKWLVK